MLGGMKNGIKQTVLLEYIFSNDCSIRLFVYRYKKMLYRYHNIKLLLMYRYIVATLVLMYHTYVYAQLINLCDSQCICTFILELENFVGTNNFEYIYVCNDNQISYQAYPLLSIFKPGMHRPQACGQRTPSFQRLFSKKCMLLCVCVCVCPPPKS